MNQNNSSSGPAGKRGLRERMSGAVDMTTGEPWRKILAFTIPMLIGNIAQQMYSTVDSIIVGRYVGDNALSAVGSAAPILNLLLVMFVGISVGIGIIVSQYHGARDRDNLSRSIGTSITLTFAASVIVMVLAPLVSRPLLKLLHTPESIIGWCESYLLILFEGVIGSAYYNILSGILRGFGESFSALVYLLVATVLNIVLDYVFVRFLGLGVSGVALATIIAQAVSALLCYRKLRQMKEQFDSSARFLKPEKKFVTMIIRLGVPSGLTQAIFSMAMLMVQNLTNSFGEQFIAANVIVMRVDGFAMLPNFSFGTALTTYAGQNIGARRMDRVRQGAMQGTLMAVGTSAVLTGLILLFGHTLMGIFTETEELVTLSRNMMGILAAGYIAMAVTQALSGIMRGAGDTMTPMWISVITTVGIRVPLAYLLVALMHEGKAIFISLLICWLSGAALTVFFYRLGKWKKAAL